MEPEFPINLTLSENPRSSLNLNATIQIFNDKLILKNLAGQPDVHYGLDFKKKKNIKRAERVQKEENQASVENIVKML